MDEPTSSLTQVDTENLFAVIGRLQERGVSVVYISHFLEECKRICGRFTVLRDGESVGTGAGRVVMPASSLYKATAGTKPVRPFDVPRITGVVGGKQGEAMASGWGPLAAAAGTAVDWFPDDAPVVLAEMTGGEGLTRDSGLSMESDRLLLRVVGEGGAP